jgi:hypothetical protein
MRISAHGVYIVFALLIVGVFAADSHAGEHDLQHSHVAGQIVQAANEPCSGESESAACIAIVLPCTEACFLDHGASHATMGLLPRKFIGLPAGAYSGTTPEAATPPPRA